MAKFARHLSLVVALTGFAPASWALPAAAGIQAAFQHLDPDHDHVISMAEWKNASFSFYRSFDQNDDHALALPEVSHENLASSIFSRTDENHDGRIDLDEYMRLRRAIFYLGDIDRSGAIDYTEFELMRMLGDTGWIDQNQNRSVDLSELRASLGLILQKADQNNDGRLTADEAVFLEPAQFRAISREGIVDLDALVARYKQPSASLPAN